MQFIRSGALALVAALAVGPALAQAPAGERPPQEPPGNEETGISIDRFIGNPDNAPVRITHDGMYIQRIFSPGDPATGSAGSVLAPGQETNLATLLAHDVTSLFRFPKNFIFYVESGEGRLDDGKQYWDLSEGLVVLVPANLAHRFTNTGDAPLKMIMFSYDTFAGSRARSDILVRDTHRALMVERNVHYAHNTKRALAVTDGTGGPGVLVITFGPMTIAGPHADAATDAPGGTQWIHVSDGPALIHLGSEIRRWPLNTGFVNPRNGRTTHNRINISDKVETFLYIAAGSGRPPGSNAGAQPAQGIGQTRPEDIPLPGRPPGQGRLGQIWRPGEVGGLQGAVSNPEIDQAHLDSIVPGTPIGDWRPGRPPTRAAR